MSDNEQPLGKEYCPNCDHDLEQPINDIWKDPMVKEALKDGRNADDIWVIRCPTCNRYGYYNQGSHFSCRFCKESWRIDVETFEEPVTLADTVTKVTDGYDNQTL